MICSSVALTEFLLDTIWPSKAPPSDHCGDLDGPARLEEANEVQLHVMCLTGYSSEYPGPLNSLAMCEHIFFIFGL